MSESLKRKRTIFLFLLIIIFAIFVSNKVNYSTDNPNLGTNEYSVETIVMQRTCTNCSEEFTESLFFEIDENFQPVELVNPTMILREADILGVQTCPMGEFIYSSRKICSRSTGIFDHDRMRENRSVSVGEQIRRDAKISLIEVEVPPLTSGSPVMDSSVRQIHTKDDGTDHWTLRPAGEMINREVVEGNMYPGDNRSREILDGAQEARNVRFGLQYQVGVSGQAVLDGDPESSFTVYQYHENDCMEDCRNNPNPTPTHHLVNANVMAWSNNYPDYYRNLEDVNAPEIIDDCEEGAQFLDMDIEGNTARACTPSIFEVFINFFRDILSPKDAVDCSEPMLDEDGEPIDQDPCVSLADIVVIMESPWGIKRDCTDVVDGKCVTDFNDLRDGKFNHPASSRDSSVYVLTKCVINIEELSGRTVGARQVKCAWDIDYIVSELRFQSFDNIPDEVYPDTMDYLEFHIEESEYREDPVFEM